MYKSTYPADRSKAFADADRVLLCLTTLLHRRFIEDALHLIALPKGSRMRLRYRRPYVATPLWEAVVAGQGVGCQLLIALGATDHMGRNVVRPLRKACVRVARCEGSVLIMDVVLEAFLIDMPLSASTWEEAQIMASGLPPRFGPEAGRGAYLQELPRPPVALNSSLSVEGWEYCAEGFFQVAEAEASGQGEECGRIPFIYYMAPIASDWALSLDESGRMNIESGAALAIEIHTMTAPHLKDLHNPIGEVRVEIGSSAASFTSTRRARVDSRRDVREVRVATPTLFRRAHGHLSVRMITFANKISERTANGQDERAAMSASDRQEIVVARYDFPLGVGRRMPVIASAFVSIAAGLATLKWPSESENWSTASVLPSVLVTFIAFAGLLLGFRKESKD